MDNKDRNSNDHLGVNKLGKGIRKSPLHQPSFANPNRQQAQPQVYNINKNDFRSVVQQLTGSPAREPNPRPANNSPKPNSQRLQRIRPPPLNHINRPNMPIYRPGPVQMGPDQVPMGPNLVPMGPNQGPMGPHMGPPAHYGNSNAFARQPFQYNQPPPAQMVPHQYPPPGSNIAESPVSVYMRILQNSMNDTGPGQVQGTSQFSSGASGLLPTPPAHPTTSPRIWGPPPPLLPSPNAQYLLPSPSSFMNLMSQRSPYPLLSPGYQFPPPLSPGFGFPPMGQTGILGPGPGQQPPVSPGISFPLSPAGFFPVSSPRWRDQKS